MAEPSPDKTVVGTIGPLITTVIGALIGWLQIDERLRITVDGSAHCCRRHKRLGVLADVLALLGVLISAAKQSETVTGGIP